MLSPAESFTARVVRHYWERECYDVDGGTLQDILVAAGLAVERPATQEDISGNDLMQEFGLDPGDPWCFPTPELEALLDQLKEEEQT